MKAKTPTASSRENLLRQLDYLKLSHLKDQLQSYVDLALERKLGPLDFFEACIQAECDSKKERAGSRRVKAARFPSLKTLETYAFHYPKKIDKERVRSLFRLDFLDRHENITFIGPTGVGKTHLATALGFHACCNGYDVLFTSAIDMINKLTEAHHQHLLGSKLKPYIRADVLVLDELGYLPIDKFGVDLLFQVISARCEHRSTIITTNRSYNEWVGIFNNDAPSTSVIIDRILQYSQTITIDGPSYRLKDK